MNGSKGTGVWRQEKKRCNVLDHFLLDPQRVLTLDLWVGQGVMGGNSNTVFNPEYGIRKTTTSKAKNNFLLFKISRYTSEPRPHTCVPIVTRWTVAVPYVVCIGWPAMVGAGEGNQRRAMFLVLPEWIPLVLFRGRLGPLHPSEKSRSETEIIGKVDSGQSTYTLWVQWRF